VGLQWPAPTRPVPGTGRELTRFFRAALGQPLFDVSEPANDCPLAIYRHLPLIMIDPPGGDEAADPLEALRPRPVSV
jgi:hypothetical protein